VQLPTVREFVGVRAWVWRGRHAAALVFIESRCRSRCSSLLRPELAFEKRGETAEAEGTLGDLDGSRIGSARTGCEARVKQTRSHMRSFRARKLLARATRFLSLSTHTLAAPVRCFGLEPMLSCSDAGCSERHSAVRLPKKGRGGAVWLPRSGNAAVQRLKKASRTLDSHAVLWKLQEASWCSAAGCRLTAQNGRGASALLTQPLNLCLIAQRLTAGLDLAQSSHASIPATQPETTAHSA
jgi:hypothetical protein